MGSGRLTTINALVRCLLPTKTRVERNVILINVTRHTRSMLESEVI